MSRSQVLRSAAAMVLLFTVACSSETPASKGPSSSTPTPSACVGKLVPVTFPRCPATVSEIGPPKDLTAQGGSVSLALIAGDAVFDPTFIKVKPGANVTLTFRGGSIRHDFNIDALDVHQDIPLETTTMVSFTLPTTGPVVFYCAPHLPNGMQGAFYFA